MAAAVHRHVANRLRNRRLGIAASAAVAIHAAGLVAMVPLLRWSPRVRDEVQAVEPLGAADAVRVTAVEQAQAIEVIPPDSEEPPPADSSRVAEHDVNPAEEAHEIGRVILRGPGRTTGDPAAVTPAPRPTEPPPLAPEVVATRDEAEDDPDEAPPPPRQGGEERGRAAEASMPSPGPLPPPPAQHIDPGDALPTVGVGGGSDDHLPELLPGTDTAVRARRSSFAAFLNQVRTQVRERWRPSEVYRRVDPSFTLKGDGRYTVLRVRVRADGSLESTDLQARSGLAALDGEAVRAMEQAQPFPRPPAELLDSSGGVAFGFSFYLDIAVASFLTNVRRTVLEQWKPSGAFKRFGMQDKVTIVRALLTADGILAHVSVVSSSGIDLLDEGALAAFKQGMRFPSPPAALGEIAGIIPVRVAFLHSVRGQNEVRILREPRND